MVKFLHLFQKTNQYKLHVIFFLIQPYQLWYIFIIDFTWKKNLYNKLEKKYAPALDNYGQSCFVRSDF